MSLLLALTSGGGGTNYTVAANTGVYAVTGSPASLLRGYRLVADSGSYSITGSNATITFTGGATDTHDGDAWVRFRKKLERIVNIQDAIEVVQNDPKEAIEAIQESNVKPKVKVKVAAID